MSLDNQFLDIQGIVMRGYGYMKAANFFLLSINDTTYAKKWLKEHLSSITNCENKPTVKCLNIAFTKSGFQKMGLPKETVEMFSRDFKDGMITEHKQRILGDIAEDAPKYWEWGGPLEQGKLDILLMLYCSDDENLKKESQKLEIEFSKSNLHLLHKLNTSQEVLESRKEHFGFTDGLSQPIINTMNRKTKEPEPEENRIAPGEILLGHENEYGKFAYSPKIKKIDDDSLIDFGKNGTYLVFRQLEQDVKTFWEYMNSQTQNEEERNMLAAKMVGRWPNGAPLVNHPTQEPKQYNGDTEPFMFINKSNDAFGFKCPIGSHIRRINPRDAFTVNHHEPLPSNKKLKKEIKKSIEFVNKHRIVRRGRPYGKPLSSTLDPNEMLNAPADSEKRGIQFICLNANIARQFELLQQTWVSNKFKGLYNDPDPIIGGPNGKGKDFTIQSEPLRKKVHNLPKFVSVKGGAYFFLPSIKALGVLSNL